MTDDATLLRRFADQADQAAFGELVQRHLPLVYSAALRQVGGDAHLAADVAQAVFTALARKAAALAAHPLLVGWLHTSTHHAAAKTVRAEQRRRHRELVASAMNDAPFCSPPDEDIDWTRLGPVLDAALHQLKETDRAALLLRYFEHQSYVEIGARIGLSENAARMKTDRALAKLRELLTQRGITSTAAALGTALTSQAITAPPAGLAALVTHTALTQAALLGPAGFFALMKTLTVPLSLGGALASLFAVSYAAQQATVAQLERDLAACGTTPAALAQPAPAPRAQVLPAAVTTSASVATVAEADPAYDLKSVDRVPRPRQQTRPQYPAELRASGIRGEAVMSFVVDRNGRVIDIQTVQTTHPLFADAAAEALAAWTFSPGIKNGRPVKTRLQIPIVFNIDRKEKNWF